jgi:signal transduction histidine kinase
LVVASESAIRVRDFGKGIDLNLSGSQPLSVRVGIAGIRERLKQFGGDLKITRVEPGTLVEATMPLFQGANDVRATS